MSLYNCKSTTKREVYRITKFTEGDPEGSYLVGPKACECEGFVKYARCKHLAMRIMFMTKHHIDDEWFLDFDSRTWITFREEFSDKSSDLIIEQVTRVADDLELGKRTQEEAALLHQLADQNYLPPVEQVFELGAPRAAPSDGEGVVSPSPPPEVEPVPAPSGVSSQDQYYGISPIMELVKEQKEENKRLADKIRNNDLWIEL